jgi:hypothetical protein
MQQRKSDENEMVEIKSQTDAKTSY